MELQGFWVSVLNFRNFVFNIFVLLMNDEEHKR